MLKKMLKLVLTTIITILALQAGAQISSDSTAAPSPKSNKTPSLPPITNNQPFTGPQQPPSTSPQIPPQPPHAGPPSSSKTQAMHAPKTVSADNDGKNY